MPKPNMMKQIQQMQSQMADLQTQLEKSVSVGTAGGGVVSVTVTGDQQVTSVTIAPEALEEGTDMLADLVMAACNDALKKSRQEAAGQMSKLGANLGLPPGLL